MADAPKRRGRPPGAKNRTKAPITGTGEPLVPSRPGAEPPSLPPEPRLEVVFDRIDRMNEPASIESYTLGPVGVKVAIRFRVGLSTDGEVKEVTWLPGWPIPQLNDVIRAGGLAGRVQFVEYDWDAGVIRITAT